MKILITGGSGFVAPHLIDYILSLNEGHKIYVLVRQRGDNSQLDRLTNLDKIQVVKGDLLNYPTVYQILHDIKPDKIFHLAAQSYVKYSFEDPVGSVHNNMMAQMNLLEAVRQLGTFPKIQIAGSSEEYGKVEPWEVPIAEDNPLRPLSPYGVSKVIQEMMAYQYYQSYKIPTIITRTFNHEGPKRGKQFFLSGVCEQIARAEVGWQPAVIEVGDLSPTRDITHVKDVVRAYWLATEMCNPGEPYNIGFDHDVTMQRLLDLAVNESKLEFEIKVKEDRKRPSEVVRLYCDSTKFRELTGWKPKYGIHDIVRETIDYWRKQYETRR